jgi:hypothetical protein
MAALKCDESYSENFSLTQIQSYVKSQVPFLATRPPPTLIPSREAYAVMFNDTTILVDTASHHTARRGEQSKCLELA